MTYQSTMCLASIVMSPIFYAPVPSLLALAEGKIVSLLPLTRQTNSEEIRNWINGQSSANLLTFEYMFYDFFNCVSII